MSRNKILYLINSFSAIGKLTISFSVALSALTGYILKTKNFDTELILPVMGVFFLSIGSSALNHIQEKHFDALMERTRQRPLPSGDISLRKALLYSLSMLIIGSILLILSNFFAFLLGLLAVVWYNLVYTNLKRKTAFAAVPGAIIGAIPPLIGWVAAGGNPLEYQIMVIAFFFFIGQIPHFWLIILKYGKEYEFAGFPSLIGLFKDTQIKRLTFTWIVALAVSSLLFPLTGIISSPLPITIIVLFSGLLILSFSQNIFSNKKEFNFRQAFFHLNLYFLLVMLLIIVYSVADN